MPTYVDMHAAWLREQATGSVEDVAEDQDHARLREQATGYVEDAAALAEGEEDFDVESQLSEVTPPGDSVPSTGKGFKWGQRSWRHERRQRKHTDSISARRSSQVRAI